MVYKIYENRELISSQTCNAMDRRSSFPILHWPTVQQISIFLYPFIFHFGRVPEYFIFVNPIDALFTTHHVSKAQHTDSPEAVSSGSSIIAADQASANKPESGFKHSRHRRKYYVSCQFK